MAEVIPGEPWTSDEPDELSEAVGEFNDDQEDLELAFDAEFLHSLRINGIAPDLDGTLTLEPEDLGIILSEVDAEDIGAVPVPSGTPIVGQTPVVASTSPDITWEWGSGSGGATLEPESLIEGVGLWGPARRIPKPIEPSSIITTFQPGHGWTLTAGSGAGTMTDDTAKFRLGAQSLRVEAGIHASSLTYVTSPTLGATVDLTTNYLELMAWLDSNSLLAAIQIEVSSNNGTNWVVADSASRAGLPRDQWTYWRVNKGSFLTLGSTDFAAINRIRFGVRTSSGSTKIASWLQQLALCPCPSQGRLLVYTEGWQTVYDAASVFISRNVMPVITLRCEAVDLQNSSPLTMTLAGVKELVNQFGWDAVPSCWAYADQDNTTIGATNMEISVLKALHWFAKNGVPNEIGWWVAGGWNLTANGTAGIAEKYSNFCATGASSIANMFPPINPRTLRMHHVQGSDGSRIANAAAYVDRIEANKGLGVIYFSNMTTGSTSGNTIAMSEVATILDDALAANVEIVTARDMATTEW